jgi:hypothetical protein
VNGCGIKKRFLEKKMERDEESSRSQGLEFERLPSLANTRSEAFSPKEVEDRVRMFVSGYIHQSSEILLAVVAEDLEKWRVGIWLPFARAPPFGFKKPIRSPAFLEPFSLPTVIYPCQINDICLISTIVRLHI